MAASAQALDGLDARNVDDLVRRAQLAREVIFGAALPADLVAEISAAYARLQAEYGEHATVAVFSSACAARLYLGLLSQRCSACSSCALFILERPFTARCVASLRS